MAALKMIAISSSYRRRPFSCRCGLRRLFLTKLRNMQADRLQCRCVGGEHLAGAIEEVVERVARIWIIRGLVRLSPRKPPAVFTRGTWNRDPCRIGSPSSARRMTRFGIVCFRPLMRDGALLGRSSELNFVLAMAFPCIECWSVLRFTLPPAMHAFRWSVRRLHKSDASGQLHARKLFWKNFSSKHPD